MRSAGCALGIVASLMLATAAGCGGSGSETAPTRPATHQARHQPPPASSAVTVGCEGITPKSGWRRQTTSVGDFGLFVEHLTSQAHELSNGNYLVKAGAAVAGNHPVTVRVPDDLRGTVGLVYGHTRGHQRSPAEAWTQVTFRPCEEKPRSGYVGGLIFRGRTRDISLEVISRGSLERLKLRR
jgi:hypothetical protein